MRNALCLIAIILVIAVLGSCRKAPQAGITTNVSGQFYDTYNQEALSNMMVKVGLYKIYHLGFDTKYGLDRYLDSVKTDVDGKYRITFTTTGTDEAYFLDFPNVPKSAAIGDKGSNTLSAEYRSKNIANLGQNNVFDFAVYHTYYMKTRVIVNNNPYPPLFPGVIDISRTLATGGPNIYKANNDTVVYIPITKRPGGFYLTFSITDPVTKLARYSTTITLTPIINKDTIQGADYTLNPATFK